MQLNPVVRSVLTPVARAVQAGNESALAPSTSLDFINGTYIVGGQLQSFNRITFSRTSNATLTDSNGRVAYAPHNLLTNSEDFEAAAWSKVRATISANVAVAPNGTTTADKLVEDTSNNSHYIAASVGTVGALETFYFYAKAAERQWAVLQLGSSGLVYYNLSSGVLGNVTGGSAAIDPVGNGWFLCSFTGVRVANNGNFIYPSTGNGAVSYLGDGTSGIFIWGAQLNVANAPVNLLTFSEQFDNAAWIKRGTCAVTPNAIAAPDGTITADLISGVNTVGNDIYSTVATVPLNSPASPSFYINKVSTTGTLRVGNPSDSSKGNWHVDLALVGSGWQRITLGHPAVTVVASFVGNGSGDGLIFLAQAGGPLSFYLWGAQLNTGSTALPYVATTSSIYLPPSYNSTTPKNLLGFTQEFDNAAWTKSNSFVQTNLLTWSEQFDNAAWNASATAITRTANTTTAPNGTLTADSATGDGTNAVHYFGQVIALSATVTYTLSFYAKANGVNFVQVFSVGGAGYANFNITAGAGVVGTSGAPYSSLAIQDVGDGWYRCSCVITNPTSNDIYVALSNSATATRAAVSFATSGGIFLWGAQLVQGSVPGDYQVTTSAAAAVQYSDPNGTRTADLLVSSATTSVNLQQSVTFTGTSATYSIYAKKGSGATEANAFRLRNTTTLTTLLEVTINYDTGALTYVTGSTGATATDVGNGWWRIALTANTGITSGNTIRCDQCFVGPAAIGQNAYIWGAQLSNSASVDPYVYNPQAAPTSTAYFGPRFDYNPVTLAANGLLIEEQRTNLLTYSQDFSNAVWLLTSGATKTPGFADPSGGTSAAKVTYGTGTSGIYDVVSVTAGITYSYSIWLRSDTPGQVRFENTAGGAGLVVNLTTTWTRFSFTYTAPLTGTDGIYVYSTGGTLLTSWYIWGAQLEAGSFATSYIPTVASQVTRAADNASMLGDNFATWFNASQGTLAVKATSSVPNSDAIVRFAAAVYDTNAYANAIRLERIGTDARDVQTVGGSSSVVTASWTAGNTLTIAGAYQNSNSAASFNGAAAQAIAGSVPTGITTLGIGGNGTNGANSLCGHVRSISYYNVRLPNTTLQSITL